LDRKPVLRTKSDATGEKIKNLTFGDDKFHTFLKMKHKTTVDENKNFKGPIWVVPKNSKDNVHDSKFKPFDIGYKSISYPFENRFEQYNDDKFDNLDTSSIKVSERYFNIDHLKVGEKFSSIISNSSNLGFAILELPDESIRIAQISAVSELDEKVHVGDIITSIQSKTENLKPFTIKNILKNTNKTTITIGLERGDFNSINKIKLIMDDKKLLFQKVQNGGFLYL